MGKINLLLTKIDLGSEKPRQTLKQQLSPPQQGLHSAHSSFSLMLLPSHCFPALARFFHEPQFLQEYPPVLLHGLQCRCLLYHAPLWAAGGKLLHCSLLHGLQGLSTPVTGAPSFPRPGCFLWCFSLFVLSSSIQHLLKCSFPEVPPAWLRCSAVPWSGSGRAA